MTTSEYEGNVGEILFYPGQLQHIRNLDKSGVTTDGTTNRAGGLPTTTYGSVDKTISQGSLAAYKSGYYVTFIGGSNLGGWTLPTHFQLNSKVTLENKKSNEPVFDSLPVTRGQFGTDGVTEHGVNFGMNKKAGMDTAQFVMYLEHTIIPLYPDAIYVPGKYVTVIVDSGPGQQKETMLASLKSKGFYIVLGVSNTTHATQAMVQNYVSFKTGYLQNLKIISGN